MKTLLSSMFDYRVKIHGYIVAGVFFIVDLIIRISGTSYFNSYGDHVSLQYAVMLGLLTVVSSKDKDDDERLVQIRHNIFKLMVSLMVVFWGVFSLVLSSANIEKISILVIVYSVEGLLVSYLIFYQLAKKYNPKWLFKEETASKDYNNLMIVLLYSLFFILIVRFVVIDILIKGV